MAHAAIASRLRGRGGGARHDTVQLRLRLLRDRKGPLPAPGTELPARPILPAAADRAATRRPPGSRARCARPLLAPRGLPAPKRRAPVSPSNRTDVSSTITAGAVTSSAGPRTGGQGESLAIPAPLRAGAGSECAARVCRRPSAFFGVPLRSTVLYGYGSPPQLHARPGFLACSGVLPRQRSTRQSRGPA